MDAKLSTVPSRDVANTETAIASALFQLNRVMNVLVNVHASMIDRMREMPMHVNPLAIPAVGELIYPFSARIPPKAETRTTNNIRIPVITDEIMDADFVDIGSPVVILLRIAFL